MEDDLQWKTTSNGRKPIMEEDLKILNVEYLSIRIVDHTQILNFSLYDQPYFFYFLNEDDLQ